MDKDKAIRDVLAKAKQYRARLDEYDVDAQEPDAVSYFLATEVIAKLEAILKPPAQSPSS